MLSIFQLVPFAYADPGPDVAAYYPSGYNLIGVTQYVSGWNNLSVDDGNYAVYRSYMSQTTAKTLYAHQEQVSVAGVLYYLLKLDGADTTGLTLSTPIAKTGRKLWGQFVYSLEGISSIQPGTWTIYYRAYTEGGTVHADVDILIRQSDGTIRSTIATNVADSPNLGTSWSTVSGTYSWASYTVVNQTDYLEIDFYADVAVKAGGKKAHLQVDDSTLAISDQTRVTNIVFPSEYTMEVEFTGSSNMYEWTQLVWTVDSAWTEANVIATLQLYNYTQGAYPTSGDGYISYVSSATPNTDETKSQTITTNPADFRDSAGNWKVKVKGVKLTSLQFDFKGDLIEFEVTYAPLAGYPLNLRVLDWDLTDPIQGAYVYVDSDVKVSDANGWANWTQVTGTVQVKVRWYGFWVNGTFSVTVDSAKTIDIQCNIFDIVVTTVEGVQGALLQYANVTVYNATSVASNKIRTGITGSDGKVSLVNVPNATLTFTVYDGASPQHVIANVTRTITTENQAETITCDQNYISTTHTWSILEVYKSALLGFGISLFILNPKTARYMKRLKERIKTIRSKRKIERKEDEKNL